MRFKNPIQYRNDSERTLVIMAKAPRPGMVKTRLAQTFSAEAANDLYRCLLKDTLTLAQSLRDVNIVVMCPAEDVSALEEFTGGHARVVAQRGHGLAAALTSVFAEFAAGGRQRVIAFNSDTPHLPCSVLVSAFEMLAERDVVIGPTLDGGYYLVGATSCYPSLFDGDGMGTNSALDTLLARARTLQLSIGLTDAFYDIDVEADLSRLSAELKVAPDRAPQTAAWLNESDKMPLLRTAAGDM
jgi:rSAM/selenodomain-associated transferase 1